MRSITNIFLILILLTACSSSTRKTEARKQSKTTVRVENQNFLDMTIYVLDQGQRIRLGEVIAQTTRIFEIPEYLVFGPTTLQFLADPVGASQTPVSEEITVTPGDQVQLIIP